MPMKLYVGDIIQTKKITHAEATSGKLCEWVWIFASAAPPVTTRHGFPV